jgi:hypothetical protein
MTAVTTNDEIAKSVISYLKSAETPEEQVVVNGITWLR